MKKAQNSMRALRVSSETLRVLEAARLTGVAAGQFIPTMQLLPTVCLACQN